MNSDCLNDRDASVPASVVAARIARILVEQPGASRVAVYRTAAQVRVVPFVEQAIVGEVIGVYDARTVTVAQLVEDMEAA